MIKRVISVCLIFAALLSIIPLSAFATNFPEDSGIIRLEDGSYIIFSTEISPARVANTVSARRPFECYDVNDELQWIAYLSATFAYSGGWYTCTNADCTVVVMNTDWSVNSRSVIRSSNNAVCNLVMENSRTGVLTPTLQMRLTCDINGNITSNW